MDSSGQSDSDDDVVGIPWSLFITMSCLAAAGLIYSTVFIIFNLVYRNDRLIKMTSPNINVVILLGTLFGYVSVVLLGLDLTITDNVNFDATVQSCTYLLTFGFTLVYGSLFAKVCRVFMIFSNLNFNGKTSRDEHLLLAVFVLLLLDLALLLPWQLVDPVTCTSWRISATPTDAQDGNTASYVSVGCASRLQIIWISVVYVYKAVLLAVGLYFTWNTRQVTLPALSDSTHIAAVTFFLIVLAVTSLPVSLTAEQDAEAAGIGTTERYAVGATAICLALYITVTILFVPKVLLLVSSRRQATAATPIKAEDTQLQFSESMRRTQAVAQSGCLSRLCCRGDDGADKYAVDVLATEIESLKRTVKEKEATIRELNDRLYVGAEQFQRYLATGGGRKPADRDPATYQSRPLCEHVQLPVNPQSVQHQPWPDRRSRYRSEDSCSTSSASDDDVDLMTSTSSPNHVTFVTSSPPRQLSVTDLFTYETRRPSSTSAASANMVVPDHVISLNCDRSWPEPEVEDIEPARRPRRHRASLSFDDSAIDNQSAPSTSSGGSRDHTSRSRDNCSTSGRQLNRSISVIPCPSGHIASPRHELMTSQINMGALRQGQGQADQPRGTVAFAGEPDGMTVYQI